MKYILSKNNAITLISLVVTIVIIIILAGITISLLIGKNGIINRAQESKIKYEISKYEEYIKLAVNDARSENFMNTIDVLARVQEILEENSEFSEAIMKRVIYEDKDTLVIVIKDYAYIVTEDIVKYAGKAEDFTIPDATVANIKFEATPTEWTNKVTLKISTIEVGYTIQYSIENANDWKNYTQEITIEDNLIVYARLSIAGMYGNYASITITNIDKTEPTANISLSSQSVYVNQNITATIAQTDNESGIKISSCKYIVTTKQTEIGLNESSYTDGTFTSNTQTITFYKAAGTYYLHTLTTDNAGNSKETISNAITVSGTYTYSNTYNYTGGIQTFVAPETGLYRLEVWGAKGGNSGGNTGSNKNDYNGGVCSGGNGGYSSMCVSITKGTTLYICAGGTGSSANVSTNGSLTSNNGAANQYNGGGYGRGEAGNGGGCTHIATVSGLLSSLSSNTSSVIIVAGGGGGASLTCWDNRSWGNGGAGGGTTGGDGSCSTSSNYGTGGTQSSPGYNRQNSSNGRGGFGYGGNSEVGYGHGGGGGAGWYGGGGASGVYDGAGGGSGYQKESIKVTTYKGTSYSSYNTSSNGANGGNGFARITFVAY